MPTVWQRHRGPYSLAVLRTAPKAKGGVRSAVEARGVATEDVEEMAEMLLTDPRDSIETVFVWSEREEQFVTWFKRASEAQI